MRLFKEATAKPEWWYWAANRLDGLRLRIDRRLPGYEPCDARASYWGGRCDKRYGHRGWHSDRAFMARMVRP